jgi:hypothetical protein
MPPMMEAVRSSQTSVDNNFTRQYIPEDNSEHHTRRRENLKSHTFHSNISLSSSGYGVITQKVTGENINIKTLSS